MQVVDLGLRFVEYLKQHPVKGAVRFNRFAPARYLARNITTLAPMIDDATLQRFEDAFNTVNGLL
jgi:hypothetical protein